MTDFYSLSVVAELTDRCEKTIQRYIKEGVVEPKRVTGNGYMIFDDCDIDTIRQHIAQVSGGQAHAE